MIPAAAIGAAHAHAAAQNQLHFVLQGDAVIAAVLCLVLLLWWAGWQRKHRCDDCGFCPIFCHCEHERSGGRDHREL
jgi:hypothetical protein